MFLDTTRVDVAPNIVQRRFAWLPSVLFLEASSLDRRPEIENVSVDLKRLSSSEPSNAKALTSRKPFASNG